MKCCKRCGEQVRNAVHPEIGECQECKCNSTLWAEFDPSLWEDRMKLKPMQDIMLLKLIDQDDGKRIVMPDTYEKETASNAILEIMEIGPGIHDNGTFIQTILTPGQRVIVAAYAVTKLELNENKVIVARERDVIMVVE